MWTRRKGTAGQPGGGFSPGTDRDCTLVSDLQPPERGECDSCYLSPQSPVLCRGSPPGGDAHSPVPVGSGNPGRAQDPRPHGACSLVVGRGRHEMNAPRRHT